MTLLRLSLAIAASHLSLAIAPAAADAGALARELIDNQRRILVLREAASREERSEARRAGQYLFFENQQLARRLFHEITDRPQDASARYRELSSALDDPAYADEDRLILRAPLERIEPRLPPDERKDARARLEALARFRQSLGKELGALLQDVPLKPGRAVPARWAAYIARLEAQFAPARILAELDREPWTTAEPDAALSEAAARGRMLEWNGEELPPRTILLTFDDGPHPLHTPAVLDILKRYGLHGVFFQIGRNLGAVTGAVPVIERNGDIEVRLAAEGHAVGNHSYSHRVMPRLAPMEVEREIADTQALLEKAVPDGPARTHGFRPPYGARDDQVLAQIDRHRLRSIVWNIDSEDWADPVAESIVHRVVAEAEKYGRGIVLMHDIHARTVEALPRVIDELTQRGFRFARWDGHRLVAEQPTR